MGSEPNWTSINISVQSQQSPADQLRDGAVREEEKETEDGPG